MFPHHIIQKVDVRCTGTATLDILASSIVRKMEDQELAHQYNPRGPMNTCIKVNVPRFPQGFWECEIARAHDESVAAGKTC